jgi:hypothetical protein
MDWIGLEKIEKKFNLFGIQTHPISLNPHGLRANRTSPKRPPLQAGLDAVVRPWSIPQSAPSSLARICFLRFVVGSVPLTRISRESRVQTNCNGSPYAAPSPCMRPVGSTLRPQRGPLQRPRNAGPLLSPPDLACHCSSPKHCVVGLRVIVSR